MKKLSIDTRLILLAAAIALSLIWIKAQYSKSVIDYTATESEAKPMFCSAVSKWDGIGLDDDVAIREQRIEYIQRFHKVAIQEYYKFGIPASIILAQGLLESKNGNSDLVKKTNNHFGIKCFSKNCKQGHCSNYSDDSHKDFFKKYPSAWESFRDHSLLLSSNRYKPLAWKSYKDWTIGLVKRKYATDKAYSQKLTKIIHNYKLYKFDK